MQTVFDLSGLLLFLFLGRSLLQSLSYRSQPWTYYLWFSCCMVTLTLLSMFIVIFDCLYIFAHLRIPNLVECYHILLSGVLSLMSMIFLGALSLGLLRLWLLRYALKKKAYVDDQQLQCYVDSITDRYHLDAVHIQLWSTDRPLALVFGAWQPVLLLSTWMLKHLDHQELEAVIVHELEHIARHDFLINWIALVLRDAFFYLPTSRPAYHQFLEEKEVACDDLAIRRTQRPLALASALTKVWLHLVEGASSPLVQTLIRTPESIPDRIRRLLIQNQSEASAFQKPHRFLHLKGSCVALLLLLLISCIMHVTFIGC